MRASNILNIVTCLILAIGLTISCKSQQIPSSNTQPMTSTDYDKSWERIDSLENLGQYRSALELTHELHTAALKERADDQWVKATLYISKYAVHLNEDGLVHAIMQMESALDTALQPARSVMYSLTARLYGAYLQQNAWVLRDRTNVSGDVPVDIREWDIAQLLDKINTYYFRSLEDPDIQSLPVAEFEAMLGSGNTDALRPTLFDLLAHEAIDYFIQDYGFITEPAYAFRLTDIATLEPAGQFIDRQIVTPDTRSFQYRAVLLFQKLLRLHLDDENADALVDADLKRLAFVHQHLLHEEKDKYYEQALRDLSEKHKGAPLNALISYRLAEYLASKGNQNTQGDREYLVEALRICKSMIAEWPDAYGTDQCRNLETNLLTTNLQVQTEQVWMPDEHILAYATYRNLPSAFIRVVRTDFEELRNLTQKPKEILSFLKRQDVLQSKRVSLPGSEDLRQHATEFAIDPLELGEYVLLISSSEDFDENSTTAYIQFHVSQLAHWQESDPFVSKFVIVDRKSGRPLNGVGVAFYINEYNQRTRKNALKLLGRDVSGEDGLVVYPNVTNRHNIILELTNGDDVLFLDQGFYDYRRSRQNRTRQAAYLFTDRSIYRPGQTIYFKGYLMQFNTENIPAIQPRVTTQVELLDANGQQVAKSTITTNDYGTFSGEFTAPDDRLLGQMMIRCNPGNGYRQVQVEEYKRPTFEVTFNEAEQAFSLDERVAVSGTAGSFAGVPIDGATYSYRVVRRANYPYWPWWRIRPSYLQSGEMEIARGTGLTDGVGNFDIAFHARSEKYALQHRPEYIFEVQVDVTDIAGETRSAVKQVVLGFVGFRFSHSLTATEDISNLASFGITANNLNGEPVTVSGSLRIETLRTPDRPLRKRFWSLPDEISLSDSEYAASFGAYASPGKASIDKWNVVREAGVLDISVTGTESMGLSGIIARPGAYKLTYRVGTSATDTLTLIKFLTVTDLGNALLPAYEIFAQNIEHPVIEPGEVQSHMMVSGLPAHVRYTVDRSQSVLHSWIDLDSSHIERQTIAEDDRGGYFVQSNFVFDSRSYTFRQHIQVPWTNKKLRIEYLSFRDKTEPGADEEWRLRISGAQSDNVVAEMLASMYDASLDAFLPHRWKLDLYGNYHSRSSARFAGFGVQSQRHLTGQRRSGYYNITQRNYRSFNWFNFPFYGGRVMMRGNRSGIELSSAPPQTEMDQMVPTADKMEAESIVVPEGTMEETPIATDARTQETATPPLQIRRDLAETVFFYPHLQSDTDGIIEVRFKMRESLTRWKFMALAHTKELAFDITEKEIVTQKELMVFPHVPRFVRQKDTVWITAKVHNMTDSAKECTVRLDLENSNDLSDQSGAFGLQNKTLSISLPAQRSESVRWMLEVPATYSAPVTYRVVAMSGTVGDGEEGVLPVLTDRVFVTETMAMHVGASQSRMFAFESLQDATSVSLTSHQFTLEFSSNPAWYAVQALPYLQEYPHACAEQQFNRLYANLLGGHIVSSFPAIERVFQQWSAAGSDALHSPLSKNQDLKSALLEETPWVRTAMSEEEQRRQLAVLMDLHRLSAESRKTLHTLQEMQLGNGGFPWFSGGRDNWYVTQYIVESAGHLETLGAVPPELRADFDRIIKSAVVYLDLRFLEYYVELKENVQAGKAEWNDNHLNHLITHYLYARAFYRDQPLQDGVKEGLDYFLGQTEMYWTDQPLYIQALSALSLHRWDRAEQVPVMRKSFEERSLYQEELGRYWKQDPGYYWYQLPIERHALMIELFMELQAPAGFVDELRLWLLTNKQTNRWETTKATSSAVYALLMHSDSWLDGAPVEVMVAGEQLLMDDPEAGSLYFKNTWNREQVNANLATIEVDNPNAHAAWGGAYWQYFEDIDRVNASADGPLKVAKELYKEVLSDQGPVLEAISGEESLAVGDKLVVRIAIEVDRDMEFIHLKDMRGSGLEPVNVLSGYRWKGGLGYYESTGDLATHFFFDVLPRGKWVFEYPLRVSHAGHFSNGIATLQCMYAPEFSSHSNSERLDVVSGN